MMKTGMVLEGGAMRGMYTAGVTDVLCENEVWVDGVLGVSAGVTFGVNYKSRQAGRTIRYNKKYCGNPNYYSIRSWLRTGDVFNVHFSYHRIPFELDPFDEDAYEANHTDFYVTALMWKRASLFTIRFPPAMNMTCSGLGPVPLCRASPAWWKWMAVAT